MRKIDFFGQKMNVYRAALHTHSTVSEDGIISPANLIARYKKEGYDVLAFTDHRRMNKVSDYDPKGLTLISGMEVHPMRRHWGELWHILALGLPDGFNPTYTYPSQAVEAIHAAGGICFMPHPYWTGFGSKMLSSLKYILGVEVYNGAVREVGKSFNMESWDEMLVMGKDYTALAVDDVHHEHDLFRGWTMVCAQDKSEKSILKALERGDFYASCGPEFKSITCENGIFHAEFTPVVAAQLPGFGRKGYKGHFDRAVPGQEPELVTSLTMDISDMKVGYYCRCQLVDAQGRMAWSNPIRRIGKGKNDFRRSGLRDGE